MKAKPEIKIETTVTQAAQLKAFDDQQWAASRAYDYEDDWQDDDV